MNRFPVAMPAADDADVRPCKSLPVEIQVGPTLGQGTSGIVSSVHAAIDHGHYVVKEVPTGDGSEVAILEEVRLHRLCSAQCSDVVRYIFAFQVVGKLLVLMERCDAVLWDVFACEPTWERFYGEQPISPIDCEAWTVGLCRAVRHCHSLRVLHRDINPWNVFIACEQLPAAAGGARFAAKLGDFGLGVLLDGAEVLTGVEAPGAASLDESALGSLYSAPELGQRYSFPADVFSLAMTLFALWLKAGGLQVDTLIEAVEAAKAKTPVPDALPALQLRNAALARAVLRMLSAEPASRGPVIDAQHFISDSPHGRASVMFTDAAVQAVAATRVSATDASNIAHSLQSLPGQVGAQPIEKSHSGQDVGLAPNDLISQPVRKGSWMSKFTRCLPPGRRKSTSRVEPFAT